MAGTFYERVWEYVREVPGGRVMTYGQVAKAARSPGAAQSVGNAMKKAKDEGIDVPWQRVVKAGGVISSGAPAKQAELLRREGISFLSKNRVDLQKYQWTG